MLVFWILATLMTLVALAFVLVPLLRARTASGPSAREANLEVLRGQKREIEADVASGVLPADARDEALAELVARAEGDLEGADAGPAPQPGRPRSLKGVVIAIVLAIPIVAFGTYYAVGTPAASDPEKLVRPAPDVDPQMVTMVEALAKKVRERPEDAQGWGLLARSMAALGRFKESADAYAHLNKLIPNDPMILADYADALGMAQGRSLAGKPYELAKMALAIDPTHRKSLALAGTAAMDAGDWAAAARYWEALRVQLDPGSPDAVQIAAIVEEVRGRAKAAGVTLPPGTTVAAAPQPAAPPPAKSVTGSVTLAPEMAARAGAADTLFIYARGESGSRMPLAILRARAADLPMKFALDDSLAMSPAARISTADAVLVEARISRTGTAIPQTGDLIGTSAVVKPGARDVRIVIDKVVP